MLPVLKQEVSLIFNCKMPENFILKFSHWYYHVISCYPPCFTLFKTIWKNKLQFWLWLTSNRGLNILTGESQSMTNLVRRLLIIKNGLDVGASNDANIHQWNTESEQDATKKTAWAPAAPSSSAHSHPQPHTLAPSSLSSLSSYNTALVQRFLFSATRAKRDRS